MRRKSAKFMPRPLSIDQKEDRFSAALYLLDCAEIRKTFENARNGRGDESWVYGNDSRSSAAFNLLYLTNTTATQYTHFSKFYCTEVAVAMIL
ncbi:hypothetical protein AVEN_93294-1 [Araneus ventricosus]|uniref:Uncharacterized protein n=1 Tax=Araneus ventricosus TaxID=182803 RepID=A0A4Y2US73_ARAVE|nr:hypothetical protein AVEN_93294-1 [Araneus ventricosus]